MDIRKYHGEIKTHHPLKVLIINSLSLSLSYAFFPLLDRGRPLGRSPFLLLTYLSNRLPWGQRED